MKITYPHRTRVWITKTIQRIIYKLDNSGDTNILKNGELYFIKNVCLEASDNFVFFDIGGNYGEYTELILRYLNSKAYSVHIFEPQSTCVKKLKEKFFSNSFIKINPFGLSEKDCSGTIYRNTDGSGLASLYQRDLKHYNIPMNDAEEITLKKSLDYVREENINHINFMKIDVEGHEVSVLKGFGEFLTPKNIDLIQFEYGGANLDSKTSLLDLFNLFHDKGFVLCKIMRNSLYRFEKYDPRFENYVYQNWVAVNPELLN
jgi:FkbM family methyltransferase